MVCAIAPSGSFEALSVVVSDELGGQAEEPKEGPLHKEVLSFDF